MRWSEKPEKLGQYQSAAQKYVDMVLTVASRSPKPQVRVRILVSMQKNRLSDRRKSQVG